jgi:hypothetical protein
MGTFTTNKHGKGHVHVHTNGNVSGLCPLVVDADLVSNAIQDDGGIQLFHKRESLIVASKVKAYIKSKSMMTSSDSLERLSDHVYAMLVDAIARTKANRRSTVKAQDL